MKFEDLVGTWQLQSYQITSPDGSVTSWGKNPHGLLIYTPDGYMSAALNRDMNEDINPFRQVIRSILFYAGTYDLKGNTITHHVLNASLRSRIGNNEIRKISWDGETMILSATGDAGRADIAWKKDRP